jgi:NAD-dependent SIR2 family protein deacetylase
MPMSHIDSNSSTLSEAARFGIDYARQQLAGKSILVLTGAGVSTESGIPDYRGEGKTERHPMTFDVFMGTEQARARYWARSYVGWSVIANAKPNGSHFALAQAESLGRISHIITQNVDSLHQQAGSKKVTELHGRLDKVICMSCRQLLDRSKMDLLIEKLNPEIQKDLSVEFTPDGDAEVEATANFKIPNCPECFGILKPDVVFFGESVPAERVASTMEQLERSDVLLVAGSSLTVNSGMRFARAASKAGKPIVIVNVGPTKADELALAKIEAPTSIALEELLID